MAITNTSELAAPTRVSPGELELTLSRIESLPTLPAVAWQLLDMTADDRYGTGEIAALVESDQSLSARILSVVRKSHIGVDVQTVDRAVVLLGCDIVRSMVLGVQVFDLFNPGLPGGASRFDRVGFWRHSLAVGCAARLMAEKRAQNLARTRAGRLGWPIARPEEAFVCGLLHDLGKVVFEFCFPKSYDRVIEKVEARWADISDVEREVFGADHTVAGHRLAGHWRLPQPIAECIWLHHQTPQSTPSRIGYPDHVSLIQAADRLVRQMQLGYSGNHSTDEETEELYAAAGLDQEAIEEVMLALPEAIEARAELLGLQRITSREVLQETLVRTNAELARVNTALTLANRKLGQRSRTLDAICALNQTLGEECRHESAAVAVADGLRMLAPSAGVGIIVSSPARQIAILVGFKAGEPQPRVEVLPNAAVGNLHGLGETGRGKAESCLPGPALDHAAMLLGAPPTYVRPVRCSAGLAAAVLVAGDVPSEVDASIKILGTWAASWLNAAELAFARHQVTEELTEINRQLIKTQSEVARMRSLGMIAEMAAGAAHELNNPLAVISGRAQLLAKDDYGEAVGRSASIIAEHAHRASAIVNELMEFAKPAPAQPTVWRIADLLGEIRRAWLDKKVLTPGEFVLQLSDDLPPVRADAGQIRLLFDELIRNAVEAMQGRDARRLTVNCQSDVADERLVVRVEDNGCGMSPDVAERAMDPFFSHRPAGRGRGLGLSRAARYAEINGGKIRLSSRVKEGTAVIVELPAAAAE